jgi:uncharacterized membrane protein (UPF0136 family)
MIGFMKANSKISLYTSIGFGAVLVLCALNLVFRPYVADIILAVLLVVFGVRLAKTRKMMPAGMMLIVTLATLVLRRI